METSKTKMEDAHEAEGQAASLALRRTHRANAGAKRKHGRYADEDSPVKSRPREKKKDDGRKKRKSLPAGAGSQWSPKMDPKQASDFVLSSKSKTPVSKIIKKLHPNNDFYCWVCHKQEGAGRFLYCSVCPRVYHLACTKLEKVQTDWVCKECEKITDAECTDTQSSAMATLTLDKIAKVLRVALNKMNLYVNAYLFKKIDDVKEFCDYRLFVYHPMDLAMIEKRIQLRCYGSTEAFLADMRWIVHNSFIYFGTGSKYGNAAKALMKICETEMSEVEVCPDCYLTAINKRSGWFTEICTKPHPLIWAKLQGFPFWPAKAMKEQDGLIEARFFGQHDKAMIPVHNCFLYSTQIPFPASKKRLTGLNSAIKEVEVHVAMLKEKLGSYRYAPHLTPYDPNKRYTTSSLAVMPDGKVKSLTDVGRNAKMKAKAAENGKDAEPRAAMATGGDGKGSDDARRDVVVATSEEDDVNIDESSKEDSMERTADEDQSQGKDGLNSAGDGQNSAGDGQNSAGDEQNSAGDGENSAGDSLNSTVDGPNSAGDRATVASPEQRSSETISMADKEHDMPGQEEKDDERIEEDGKDALKNEDVHQEHSKSGTLDEESVDNDDGSVASSNKKRKLSESLSDQAQKISRISPSDYLSDVNSQEDIEGVNDGEGDERTNGQLPGEVSHEKKGSSPCKLLNELDDIVSNTTTSTNSKQVPGESGSVESEASAKGDQEELSILPSHLPNLDNREASASSESCSSFPDEDAKSNQATPRKDTFLLNLSKTIDTCKASLGIDEEEVGRDGGEEEDMEEANTTGDETMESEEEDAEAIGKGEEAKVWSSSGAETKVVQEGDVASDSVDSVGCTGEGGINEEDDDDASQGIIGESEEYPPVVSKEGGASRAEEVTMETQEVPTEQQEKVDVETEGKDRLMQSEKGMKQNVNELSDKDDGAKAATDQTVGGEGKESVDAGKESSTSNVDQKSGAIDANKVKVKAEYSCDDDPDDGGMFGVGSSSDGELLIDEGGDKQMESLEGDTDGRKGRINETEESASSSSGDTSPTKESQRAGSETAESELPTKESVKDGDRKEGLPPQEEEGEGKEVMKESNDKEAEPCAREREEKPVDMLEKAIELLSGKQKLEEKDPDYAKLIAKVVDDAVKSFKELDGQLSDASADVKAMVLNLKREVIALRAKQDLQQKELMHCQKLAATEIRQAMEYSRDKKLNQIKRKYDQRQSAAVAETKTRQWCASCSQEANYFCCWNTCYCSYRCQEDHWHKHVPKCQQMSGHFPFMPGPDFDPFRKRKKKKKKRKPEVQAWNQEYGNEESDEDPTWQPDPEDLPTMVPRKKPSYPIPAQRPPQQGSNRTWSQPNILKQGATITWNQERSKPGVQVPNKTWTQPSRSPNTQLGPGVTSSASSTASRLAQARQILQSKLHTATSLLQNVPTSKPVYIPVSTPQSRIQSTDQTVLGTKPVFINTSQGSVKLVQFNKNKPNVLYVGATPTTGVQMQTAIGGSGGITNQPIRFQLGPNNKMSSLVQALGQPLQQGGKYVIQLTAPQQGSNMQQVKAVPMVQTGQGLGGQLPVGLASLNPGGAAGVVPGGGIAAAAVAGQSNLSAPRVVLPRVVAGVPGQVIVNVSSIAQDVVSNVASNTNILVTNPIVPAGSTVPGSTLPQVAVPVNTLPQVVVSAAAATVTQSTLADQAQGAP